MTIKIRKSIYDLNITTELPAFIAALDLLKTSGVWNEFVRIHMISMNRRTLLTGETMDDTMRNAAHRGPSFLPWHRVFLYELEQALEVVAPGSNMALPYWPWEEDETLADPTTADIFSDDYLGEPTGCLPPPNNVVCNVSGVANTWIALRQRFETVGATNEIVQEPVLNPDGTPVLNDDGTPAMANVPVLDADGDPTFVDGGTTGDVFGQFVDDFPNLSNLFRVLGDLGSLPMQSQIDNLLQYSTYDRPPWDDSINGNATDGSFRNRLEGWALEPGDPVNSYLHNIVHVFIGGDMGPGTSPNDPIFFLHHCNVDRIWAKWQEKRVLENGTTYNSDYLPISGGPLGHNLNDNMFPWNGDPKFPALADSWAPTQTLDYIDAMEFIYDDVPRVSLQFENLVFGSVISGETSYRAATFDVVAAYPVTFQAMGLPPAATGFLRPPAEPNPVVVNPTAPDYDETAYVWFLFEGGSGSGLPSNIDIQGEMRKPDGTIVWQHTFTVTLSANTVARPNVASVLVLDQSNSMNFDAGNGNDRIDVLHFSAPPFIELLDVGNGIGIVAFDHDPHERMDVKPMPGAKAEAEGHLVNHTPNPLGNTSIADGIELAQAKINEVSTDYDESAIIVLTDGHETAPKLLENLDASVVQSKLFAIGLGSAEHIQPERLADIAGSNDGYMLLTGELATDGTDEFLLTKYYLQILANVTNMEITLDPEGWVGIGKVVREPFVITSADIQADIILLTEIPGIEMLLESPNGEIIQPSSVIPGVELINGQTTTTYRVRFPVKPGTVEEHQGSWNAVLRLDPRRLQIWIKKKLERNKQIDVTRKTTVSENPVYEELKEIIEEIRRHGLRYSLNVHTWSNLKMSANLYQNSYEPEAKFTLRTIVTEYGVPLRAGAKVKVEVKRPDQSTYHKTLSETETGIFELKGVMDIPGIWHMRVLAKGYTRNNELFTREHLLTGHVRWGGDQPASRIPDSGNNNDKWCQALKCLMKNKGVRELMKKYNLDAEELSKCLTIVCEEKGTSTKTKRSEIDKLTELLKQPELKSMFRILGQD